METPVLVALIASIASVVVALVNLFWTARQKRQEQHLVAKAELDRYREPLLFAADELGNRIDNIRNKGYLRYLDIEAQRELALRSTLFRIAQFFGWVDILYGVSGHIRFALDSSTRTVAETLGWIASAFAEDRFDQAVDGDIATTRLAIRREEQRAIGELMRRDAASPACVGYSSFVKNFDEQYAPWLTIFAEHLQSMHSQGDGPSLQSERLEQLHALLAKLIVELDVGNAITRLESGKLIKPRWAQPSRFTGLRSVEEVVATRTASRSAAASS